MLEDDLARVRHMLGSAREALVFASQRVRSDLDNDRMLTLALVRSVEVIGEAASRISVGFRRRYPDLPWRDIVSMRNRLIHTYFNVNLDIVWSTVVEDLPPLVAQLEQILADEDAPEGAGHESA